MSTVHHGLIGSRLWLLSQTRLDKEPLTLTTEHGAQPALPQWYASRGAFLFQALKGANLLPNSDFGGQGEKSLAGWIAEATAPGVVDIDFSDDWRLDGAHSVYLFAPVGVPSPSLRLQEPVSIRAGLGFAYRLSGFFATHRAEAWIEIDYLDAERRSLQVKTLHLPTSNRYPGGHRLTDYRWCQWLVHPPHAACWANLRLRLGEHSGQGDPSRFLFLTLPTFGVADEAPSAWQPTCSAARRLLALNSDPTLSHCALLELPADVTSLTVGERHYPITPKDTTGPPLLLETRQTLLGAWQRRRSGPVWLATRWPLQQAPHLIHEAGQSAARLGVALDSEDCLAQILNGENLLLNSDFSQGLAHWEVGADFGVDFSPSTKPAGGHAAYLYRRAATDQDTTRLYRMPVTVPTRARAFQLRGLFGYHRCLGHLGVQWLDVHGEIVDEVQLQPKKPNACGETRFADYDLQEQRLTRPENAVAARLFVAKTPTESGQHDSFVFFTRLFFGPADLGRVAWRAADPELLEQAASFVREGLVYQRLEAMDAGEARRYRALAIADDGPELPIEGSDDEPTASADSSATKGAVVNGRFEYWSRGLAQCSRAAHFEAADDWGLLNPAETEVSVAAARLRTRDPWQGDPGELSHALELRFESAGDSVVLLGRVRADRLEPRRPARLRLYLMTAENQAYACLNAIELRLGEDRVITLARRVAFGALGRYFEFHLSLLDVEHLRQSGEAVRLALDFGESNACLVADVGLSTVVEESANTPASLHTLASPVSLEDLNLALQCERVKGTEHWIESKPLTALAPYAPLSEQPRVEIIVPVYNALEETLDCLRSVRLNTTLPYALTVIDDASEPDVAQALCAYRDCNPGLRLIRNETNLGYTRSANLGFAQARADWVVLLNSDTLVTPGWLEGLLACAESDPAIRFVGPLSNAASWQSVPAVLDAGRKFKVNALPSGYTPADMARLVAFHSCRAYPRVRLLNGFCTLIHRDTVMALGLLDEQAFPQGYGEENDLCLRAAAAGHQLAIADDVYVYHAKSASFGHARRAELSKAGGQALRAKHPGVDLDQAQAKIAEHWALIQLRQALSAHLESASR